MALNRLTQRLREHMSKNAKTPYQPDFYEKQAAIEAMYKTVSQFLQSSKLYTECVGDSKTKQNKCDQLASACKTAAKQHPCESPICAYFVELSLTHEELSKSIREMQMRVETLVWTPLREFVTIDYPAYTKAIKSLNDRRLEMDAAAVTYKKKQAKQGKEGYLPVDSPQVSAHVEQLQQVLNIMEKIPMKQEMIVAALQEWKDIHYGFFTKSAMCINLEPPTPGIDQTLEPPTQKTQATKRSKMGSP